MRCCSSTSRAFCATISTRRSLSPRCGAVRVTAPPRFCRSHARNASASSGSRCHHQLGGDDAAPDRRTAAGTTASISSGDVSRVPCMMKNSRPTSLPPRKKKTCAQVSSSSLASAITSWSSGPVVLMIFCFSSTCSTARTRSRSAAARSNSRFSDASLHLASQVVQHLVVLALEEEHAPGESRRRTPRGWRARRTARCSDGCSTACRAGPARLSFHPGGGFSSWPRGGAQVEAS